MKRTIRLTESDLHKVIKEAVNRIYEGGQQYRFNSADKKLALYEQLIANIRQSAERIMKIVDNSTDYDGGMTPAIDPYDEHELYLFAENILKTIDEHFMDGYDPTSYNVE